MINHHLSSYEPLVQLLFESMDLDERQQDELIHPHDTVLDNPAVQSIVSFLRKAQRLIVCGDYDCDGIASTSIAVLLARKLGIDVGYYLPNRLIDGYGVSDATIQKAYERQYTDVLIIDNGVKAQAQIAQAQALGMRVAVVDHHLIEEPLELEAFLHPDHNGPYGASMCASGLIYCVAEAMGLDDEYMLALACLGTIADVMPLWGKNREIVRRGIEVLPEAKFLQFDSIVKPGKYTQYSAKTLAFQMIPKINSIGRMADLVNVNTAVAYFTTQDVSEIRSYAKQVLSLNDYRKKLGKKQQELAERLITADPIQVIHHRDFHEGLVGIVANKIADITQKPTIVLAEYDDYLKGSARSMTISLSDMFSKINRDYFLGMGGHDFAFGMTVKRSAFETFREDINAIGASYPTEVVKTDALVVATDLVTPKAMSQLASFEPYGEGFSLPQVAIDLPSDYRLIDLKGYGFKFVFTNFVLDEAVFFTGTHSQASLMRRHRLIGSFDLSNPGKCAFNVTDVI